MFATQLEQLLQPARSRAHRGEPVPRRQPAERPRPHLRRPGARRRRWSPPGAPRRRIARRTRCTATSCAPATRSIPILYEVDRIRDGRSFTTRRVLAIQRGEAIFNMAVSYQDAGRRLRAPVDARGDAGEPDGEPYEDAIRAEIARHGVALEADDRRFDLPIEVRTLGGLHFAGADARAARTRSWMRARGALPRRSAPAPVPARLRVGPDAARLRGEAAPGRPDDARLPHRQRSTTRCGSTARSASTTGCSTCRRAPSRRARAASRAAASTRATASWWRRARRRALLRYRPPGKRRAARSRRAANVGRPA